MRPRRWRRLAGYGTATVLVLALAAWAGLGLLFWIFPFPQELLQPGHGSLTITDCHGQPLMVFLDGRDCWNFPVPLHCVAADLQQAIISAEDQNFYRHNGIDYLALGRAFIGNVTGIWRYSGASTITMQTVRLLQPRPRNLWSKAIEGFRSWQLERLLSKQQILQLYLNRTPYGGNLIGVEAAARKYFGKHAYELSLAQASLLAGLLQSPSRYRPDRHPELARRRRAYVLRRMYADGYIDRERYRRTVADKTEVVWSDRSFIAPHYCYLVKNNYPGQRRLRTTIDQRQQRLAERLLRQTLAGLSGENIDNGAVVIVENAGGEIRAMVGSGNFFGSRSNGQVNGATARRSPGSTLKPFTYALAFARGVATPATVLADTPLSQGLYRPQNYDQGFRGPVSAATALAQSLNVPAVRLQQRLGTEALLRWLRQAGLQSLASESDQYGLALTLGSCEVTLVELVEAYAVLARLGWHRPLRYLQEQPRVPGRRLLSAGACYLTATILRNDNLSLATVHVATDSPPFAWKTGTSSGHKDAWTVLFNRRYTIGVWLGNFDGRPSPRLVGAEVAAPLAYAIFRELPEARQWYPQPQEVGERQVCPVSGDLPRPGICRHRISSQYLPGISPEYFCRVHHLVELDCEHGYAVCPRCRPNKVRQQVVEKWPLAVAHWLKQRGDRLLMPPHHPACTTASTSNLQIISPANASRYYLDQRRQYISLKAISRANTMLYWFVNNRFLQTIAAGNELVYRLQPGTNRFRCIDEYGHQAQVTVNVASER